MITGDITFDSIQKEIIEKSLENNVEFIIATPPCQGMSLAGHKDPDDVRNFLITYAIKIIKNINHK